MDDSQRVSEIMLWVKALRIIRDAKMELSSLATACVQRNYPTTEFTRTETTPTTDGEVKVIAVAFFFDLDGNPFPLRMSFGREAVLDEGFGIIETTKEIMNEYDFRLPARGD